MPFVRTPGATLFVTEAGSPERPAILFSNSLGTTHRMWDAVVDDLAVDHRCVRYDTRGHGSSRMASASWDMDDLADDAIAILDNLGIATAHFAGLSLGGMVGQALASRYPERLRSLTLLATAALMPPPERWRDRADLVRRDGMASVEAQSLERWFTPGFAARDPGRVSAAGRELRSLDPMGYAAACEAIASADLRERLGTIAVPTSVVAGQDDPATPPAMVRELHEAIRGSGWTLMSPAAHLIAIERPGEVAEHLRSVCGAADREGRAAAVA
ncbi:3-oxoadipate enol-lactonase [Aureimonas ureilytica]|uniref:3-oxoadipate enol-lactonase n=1 Tax=Aureimonas ureilytica TaxID=401562 RepID=UPI00036F3A09|nr:3-oxoadipate enol-lactonase [Aureimonas ureilytica]